MADDVYQTIIAWNAGGQFVENVQHWINTGVTGSPTPEADALALNTVWASTILPATLPMLAPEVYLLGVRSTRVNATGGPSSVLLGNGSQIGTGSAAMMTSRDAALFTNDYYDSGSAKPKWRSGKQYLAGIYEGSMVDNLWTGAFITLAQAWAAAMNATLTGSGNTFDTGVWSTKESAWYNADNWELSPFIGGQRRRIHPGI